MDNDDAIPSQYGFYFEKAGLSGEQGQTLASEEIFRGGNQEMATSVTRELIQNSIDAKAPNADGPVRVEFDLKRMPVTDIPDHENLERHIRAAAKGMNVDKNNKRLSNVLKAFENGTIPVLRVGDYNTTGLTGSESKSDLGSPSAPSHVATVSAPARTTTADRSASANPRALRHLLCAQSCGPHVRSAAARASSQG